MTFVDQLLLSLCGNAAGCGELSVSATSQSEPCISWGPQPVETKEFEEDTATIFLDRIVLFCMDGQKKTMTMWIAVIS